MDEATSIKVCGLIAGVLASDQEMHDGEADFLQRVRKSLGVERGTLVEPILDRKEAIARLQSFPPAVREETFDLLIQAAASDGQIAPSERAFLGAVAAEMQVSADDLDTRLQSAIATSKPQPFGLATTRDDD